jgi:glyoxylase-like metal-dependent hydrolase (beta-lactamase superfamily II)
MKLMLKTISLVLGICFGLLACRPEQITGGSMLVHTVVVGQLEVNCFIVSDGKSPEAIIIDPGDDHERIAEVIEKQGLTPRYVVLTHAHYDHVCAAGDLHKKYGIPVVMHEAEKMTYEATKKLCISWGFSPDDFPADFQGVKEGDNITVGSLSLGVIHTPGHTPGGMCLSGGNTLFTGDTLFKGSVGRTDLPGGNTQQLMSSLKKLTALPPDTRVLCGHGEGTTIGNEVKGNPYLNEKSRLKIF